MIDSWWDHLKTAAWGVVWAGNLAQARPLRAGTLRFVRIFHMVARELGEGQLGVRAGSLVYTTLLSLVPVLAVSFSVLKAFEVHYRMLPLIASLLEPLGDQGIEIGVRVLDFVENVKVAGLGSMGVALLLFTVISLLQKVEQAFNYAWRIERPRRFAERFSSYLTVVLVGPVLVFTALGVTATVTGHALFREAASIGAVGYVLAIGAKLLPYLLVVAAFAFAYVYIPNTKVRLRSALVGALVAGVLWEGAGWAFATLVAGSTKYAAIYSSFAILVLFMMWVYIAWLIVLAGASVAFYHQNPEYLGLLGHEVRPSARLQERLALSACAIAARRHREGARPCSSVELARRLGAPLAPLQQILAALERRGLLVRAAGEAPRWLPGRAPEATSLAELIEAARSIGESHRLTREALELPAEVEELIGACESRMVTNLGERTLADLIAAAPAAEDEAAAPVRPAQWTERRG